MGSRNILENVSIDDVMDQVNNLGLWVSKHGNGYRILRCGNTLDIKSKGIYVGDLINDVTLDYFMYAMDADIYVVKSLNRNGVVRMDSVCIAQRKNIA